MQMRQFENGDSFKLVYYIRRLDVMIYRRDDLDLENFDRYFGGSIEHDNRGDCRTLKRSRINLNYYLSQGLIDCRSTKRYNDRKTDKIDRSNKEEFARIIPSCKSCALSTLLYYSYKVVLFNNLDIRCTNYGV